MNECMNEWMNEWINEWMNELINEWMNKRITKTNKQNTNKWEMNEPSVTLTFYSFLTPLNYIGMW